MKVLRKATVACALAARATPLRCVHVSDEMMLLNMIHTEALNERPNIVMRRELIVQTCDFG